VQITPLMLSQLPISRRGLTEFTFSRFLVPYLCGYVGSALFMDADMVVSGDVAELIDSADLAYDVQVMHEQDRFEWASLMLFNNARCTVLTPEYIDDTEHNPLELTWARSIGDIPREWNHCVGYEPPRDAKLYHYTQGIPCWPETSGLPEDEVWHKALDAATYTVTWKELMGHSVHAKPTLRRFIADRSPTA